MEVSGVFMKKVIVIVVFVLVYNLLICDSNLNSFNIKEDNIYFSNALKEEVKDIKEYKKKEKNIIKEDKDDLSIKENNLNSPKYGVIINKVTNENNSFYYEYDSSNYNASLEDLVKEAKYIYNINYEVLNNVFIMTNNMREYVNATSLTFDYNLSICAIIRAIELAYTNKLEHKRPNGSSWNEVLDLLNYSYGYAGENIGRYYKDEEAIINAWYNSNGHYKNIINEHYNKIGLGYYNLNGDKYWVQLFSD